MVLDEVWEWYPGRGQHDLSCISLFYWCHKQVILVDCRKPHNHKTSNNFINDKLVFLLLFPRYSKCSRQQRCALLESREFRNMAAACWKPCRYKTTLIFSPEKHLLLSRRKKHLGEAILPVPFVYDSCFPSFHTLNAFYFHSAFWAVQVHVFHFFHMTRKSGIKSLL